MLQLTERDDCLPKGDREKVRLFKNANILVSMGKLDSKCDQGFSVIRTTQSIWFIMRTQRRFRNIEMLNLWRSQAWRGREMRENPMMDKTELWSIELTKSHRKLT